MFNSVHEQPRLSKSAMLDRVPDGKIAIVKSSLPPRNTLDYTYRDGERRIRLHATDILIFHRNGGFTIDTGGWNTLTTRDRLNSFLPSPWCVFTEKGRAHLRNRETHVSTPFLQTISVNAKGIVKPDMKPEADVKLQKQIDAYMGIFKKKGLPTVEQSGGDPWIFTTGKVEKSVMLDWLKSRYVHRRLYVMALQYTKLTETGIYFRLQNADKRGLDACALRQIRRYIRACIGLAA